MSRDYTKAAVAARVTLKTAGSSDWAVANATTPIKNSIVFGKSHPFRVTMIRLYVTTAATLATQTVILQKSDTAGAFGSPTTLATITVLSSSVAGTMFETAVAVADSDLVAGEAVRLASVATGTDASFECVAEIVASPAHC